MLVAGIATSASEITLFVFITIIILTGLEKLNQSPLEMQCDADLTIRKIISRIYSGREELHMRIHLQMIEHACEIRLLPNCRDCQLDAS